MKILNYLLIFLPLSLLAEYLHFGSIWVFVFSLLAILPLAEIMGQATEELSKKMGSTVGSLLNATFGNAAELILAIFALQRGLTELVKATITGSIISNILLVLGLSVLVGGIRYKTQVFNRHIAGTSATVMALVVIGLLLPAIFYHSLPAMPLSTAKTMSLIVGLILFSAYAANLFFSLHTHRDLFLPGEEEGPPTPRSGRRAIIILLLATIFIAWESELLIGSLEPVLEDLGWSRLFMGVIIIPLIGNAAEHMIAVVMAAKNRVDLALGITIGSSAQIALFVAPLLLFIGLAMGQPLTLIFNPFEVSAIAASILIVNLISRDGEVNWFEGFLLLATYLIIAIGFYFT